MPALRLQPRAVGETVLHRIVVEQLVGLGADLPPAVPLGRDRPRALGPAGDVEVVDQPVEDEAAVEPGEIAVVADLVGQLGLAGRLRREADRGVLAIGPDGNHVADGALVDLVDGPGQRQAVAAHQPAGDLEVLLRGFLARPEHAADARGIDGERFFHEDVAALGHGILHVDGPEARRRGQQHQPARRHGVDGLLVGVQADELPLLGHVHFCLCSLVRALRLDWSRLSKKSAMA